MGKKVVAGIWDMPEGKKTLDELRVNYEMANIKPMQHGPVMEEFSVKPETVKAKSEKVDKYYFEEEFKGKKSIFTNEFEIFREWIGNVKTDKVFMDTEWAQGYL